MACQEIVFPSFPTENKEWEFSYCGCLTAALYLPIFTAGWPAGQGESHGETLNFLVDNKSSHPVEIIAQFLTHRRVTKHQSTLPLLSHTSLLLTPPLLSSSSTHT